MSKITKRVELANQKNITVSFHEVEGNLVIERPGDTTLTSHAKVQTDLGSVDGALASWVLDAALGEVSGVVPTPDERVNVLLISGLTYPEVPKSGKRTATGENDPVALG